MLDEGELDRRLKGMRILRGYTQEELGARLDAAGLNKTDIGKIERGERWRLTDAMRQQLVAILRVPESYFLEPDLDKVLFRTPPPRLAEEPPPKLEGEIGRDAEDSSTTDQGPPQTGNQEAGGSR